MARTAPQGCPVTDRRDGVCRSFVVPASDRKNKSSHSQVGECFTYMRALARWNVPMFPAFLASKIATGEGKNSHFPIQKKIPPTPEKIVLTKSHQFVRMLNAEQTARNFQFFPLLPVRVPLSLPLCKAKSSREGRQKELICSSFSRYANN